jgi:hypothetical protein
MNHYISLKKGQKEDYCSKEQLAYNATVMEKEHLHPINQPAPRGKPTVPHFDAPFLALGPGAESVLRQYAEYMQNRERRRNEVAERITFIKKKLSIRISALCEMVMGLCQNDDFHQLVQTFDSRAGIPAEDTITGRSKREKRKMISEKRLELSLRDAALVYKIEGAAENYMTEKEDSVGMRENRQKVRDLFAQLSEAEGEMRTLAA